MSETWIFVLKIIGIIFVSYFIGNINFAEIFARARHIDIHQVGSGNPGTMNMLRTCGVGAAIATLLCDVLKGVVPAIGGYFVLQSGNAAMGITLDDVPSPFLGYYVSGVGKLGMITGGLFAVVGHIVPVLNKFRGGKGVATALGVFIAMNPFIAVGTFLMGLIYLMIGKYGCVSSFICIISNSVAEITLAAVYGDNVAVIVLVAALCVLVVAVHYPNIIRLAKGTESDSNLLRKFKSKKSASAEAGATVDDEQGETDESEERKEVSQEKGADRSAEHTEEKE